MLQEKRIEAFEKLSHYLLDLFNNEETVNSEKDKNIFDAVELSVINNRWFSKESIENSIKAIAESIKKEEIDGWLRKYAPYINSSDKIKNVGVIMAGNIPLVGFHDFFYVLMSGNRILAKLSSDDKYLLPAIAEKLIEIEPEFKDCIVFVENLKVNLDAVIATGSNNSSRYFEYYFNKYPHIIRRNRNSISVLNGQETTEELSELGKDIFTYFGLGCRNVSKIFIPVGYNLDLLINSMLKYNDAVYNNKYTNNFNYNKSIYILNQQPFYDTGFMILKEDSAIASPVSVVHFEYYKSLEDVKNYIDINKEAIQCVVSNDANFEDAIRFGGTQSPGLSDYADGVDVMDFLVKL